VTDVRIGTLHSTVETVRPETLLSPDVLTVIVAAVRADMATGRADQQDRAEDVDIRSVVEQQRAGRR
jgi:hypothetical protein